MIRRTVYAFTAIRSCILRIPEIGSKFCRLYLMQRALSSREAADDHRGRPWNAMIEKGDRGFRGPSRAGSASPGPLAVAVEA